MANRLKMLLEAGRPILSVNPGGVAFPVVDTVGRLGAGCIFIDCERTAVSVQAVPPLARAAQAHGMGALVRSESKDPAILIRYLDCGIDGLVMPRVESAAECEVLVASARAQTHGREGDVFLVAQIESVAGLDRLDEIAAAPGIDLLLIGPNDLAQSMGFFGDPNRPEVRAAVYSAASRIAAHGRPFGLPVTVETASSWLSRGAQFLYTSLEQLLAQPFASLRRVLPPGG